MRDPFPPGPAFLTTLSRPISTQLGLRTLPSHIHELLISYTLYSLLFSTVSPRLCTLLIPRTYNALTHRQRINFDSHVVSLVQSLFINAFALYVLVADPQRGGGGGAEDWADRIWGYNGAVGAVQACAAGYFVWDMGVSVKHLDILGVSSLVHAVAALGVTLIGFRPFANYYGLRFVLYELSTPFLNIHWFLDKLSLTGSTAQLVNGIVLLASFGGSRLLWGSWQSYAIYRDLWQAWQAGPSSAAACEAGARAEQCTQLPAWLAIVYVGANTALMGLNVYWYWMMIGAVRRRFVPSEKGAKGAKGTAPEGSDRSVHEKKEL